ncbi:uncharacterized protein MYCFIDRAFT_85498 [Pseudocercospora fijiensis CIRAD86]|uniref:SprT-like domain-containing protein n=1 Tax=Pseudocercospora fijiensis (strain CIRAD86) TaxID=383855 RepID=M2Z1F3_PSEFD|nr:uncharacterized protein MYCFIDRAFT_85498 [Pseudocercospora fijiensis CIRAD86]EME83655.1 hypothetical protein MYCFIDRAFT_85498 [Pseudocercospora fijiensis CIRAD86]
MNTHLEPSEVLLYQSHHPISLAEAAIASFDTKTPRSAQMAQQLPAWFLKFQRQVDQKGEHTTELTTQLMREGWALVSKTFFLDSVSDVPVSWDSNLLSRSGSRGETSGVGQAVMVKLYPYKTARMLLNTMAHEAAHAFISMYSCHNEVCGDAACVKEKGVSMGVKGHGLAWNMLAMAIERASEVFLDFRLDLGRASSSRDEHELLDRDHAVEALFGGVDPRRDIPHPNH